MFIRKYKVLVLLMWLMLARGFSISAQPYFDVAGLFSWYIPAETGDSQVSEVSATAFIALPFDIGKRDKLIFCPLFETRWMEYEKTGDDFRIGSMSLLMVWRHESRDSVWTLTTTLLPRTNSSNLTVSSTTLQPGCAIINTFRISSTFKLKVGAYYNTEYYGGYFLPLAGLDWKISEKWNLFGVLPNTLKLEYKASESVYTGISLKTFTNSYKYENEQGFLKVKDNHLCAFADFYLPGKITLMAEAGHTLFKKFDSRNGISFPAAGGDSFIFKAGVFYRIRLD